MSAQFLTKRLDFPTQKLSEGVREIAIFESIKNQVPIDIALAAIASAAFNNLKEANLKQNKRFKNEHLRNTKNELSTPRQNHEPQSQLS